MTILELLYEAFVQETIKLELPVFAAILFAGASAFLLLKAKLSCIQRSP